MLALSQQVPGQCHSRAVACLAGVPAFLVLGSGGLSWVQTREHPGPTPHRSLTYFLCLEATVDLRSGYNHWQICGEGGRLLKWQQLRALHQPKPVAPGQRASLLAPLLPLSLSLLTFLQALLRVIVAIR